jgi:putative ABC transport system substrate-binding protein
MRRRQFMVALGLVTVWPSVARAEQVNVTKKIAVLMGSATTELGRSHLATFSRRLAQLGWVQARNAQIGVRWWTGGLNEMRPVVAELLGSSPDVIMVFSNLALALVKPMAGDLPVVFVGVGDPVGDGFVTSLAHPGANITGFAGTDGPIGGKWLEVLKQAAPRLGEIMMLMHPETPIHRAFSESAETAAPRLGMKITRGGVHDAAEIADAISSFATKEDRGIMVFPHAITWANEELIIGLSLRHRLPSHFATAASVMAGGLVSYGHDFEDSFYKTAGYVDRILRGEKPGDLPVQMPTRFRLVFNLKTAKAIGLEIPSPFLAQADEVIE